uniref:Uncharacterized protein n=1 Tax=Siphoviridae sp. ctdYc1 TaxID=2826399 RepID=A0A8S5N149_9CAUD|nr:MAG TPA: hypothetical protein [Siphoviridae sp. ctdYc1]
MVRTFSLNFANAYMTMVNHPGEQRYCSNI